MRAHPGGQIDPSEVVGRDALIARLWHALDGRSLVLSAERRMGKTTICKKMVAESPHGVKAYYHDLEGIRTPLGFVETVYHDVEGHLGGVQRTAKRARTLLSQLSGGEIKAFGVG